MRSSMLPVLGFVSGGLLPLAAAITTLQCCDLLYTTFPGDLHAQDTSTYEFEANNFWSATEDLEPACVFLPDSTAKVSAAVALFSANECKFAIKGGGHSPIPGAANIHDGILMPMELLNTTVVDTVAETITVGAGKLLGQIYADTDPYNYTGVIGRYGKVGMGLGVGAGISYWTNRDGLAVDNILNYEVVLADGTVVNANNETFSDLFWALKGGNNNFGVVTHFTLRAFPFSGRVLGGMGYYPESSLDQLADVIYDYHTRQAVDDHLTHTLPQYTYNGTSNETTGTTPIVYNADVQELPEILQSWNTTPHTKFTVHNRQYANLSAELNDGFPDGQFQEQRVITVYADAQYYKDAWWQFRVWLKQWQGVEGFYGLHCNMPITPNAIQQGILRGGNALGLERGGGNRTLAIFYFGVTFTLESDRERILTAHDEFVQSMADLAESRGLLHPYIMNTYSAYDQPAIASYGEENNAKLRAVQAIYDPTHVFQRLVPGGQKLPSGPPVSAKFTKRNSNPFARKA